MNLRWELDRDGDYNLYINERYRALLTNRSWADGSWRFVSYPLDINLGLVNLDEVKAMTLALITFNE